MTAASIEDQPAAADERVQSVGAVRRLILRPEFGALAGAVAIWLFFLITAGDRGFLTTRGTASYLQVASELGILAITVCLLMIGGEFDLSIGSMIGATGMIMALLPVKYGWDIWAAIAVSLLFALVVGALNGFVVLQTGLPSFIVTLSSLFILRGATIGLTRKFTGRTNVGGIADVSGYKLTEKLFAHRITIAGAGFPSRSCGGSVSPWSPR